MSAPRFAIIGAAGFVAPRHLEAIRDVGGVLLGALDIHDCVGILDSYFPECRFFTSPERFDRWLYKTDLDYVSICSPNWLHDAHCRWALRAGAHAICEKPLVIKPWNVDQLVRLETETGRNVYPVLQLRCHPQIQALKQRVDDGEIVDVYLRYITRRGRWYHESWKGDVRKSGGLTMNLGIHLFDALQWIHGGAVVHNSVTEVHKTWALGNIDFRTGKTQWFLSAEERHLPKFVRERGGYAHRIIEDQNTGEVVADFSEGFTSLHTQVYQRILNNDWITAVDARPAIELVQDASKAEETT